MPKNKPTSKTVQVVIIIVCIVIALAWSIYYYNF